MPKSQWLQRPSKLPSSTITTIITTTAIPKLEVEVEVETIVAAHNLSFSQIAGRLYADVAPASIGFCAVSPVVPGFLARPMFLAAHQTPFIGRGCKLSRWAPLYPIFI